MENPIVEVKENNISLTSQSMLTVAEELSKFIKEKKLSSNIQGKEYVNVEGWQFSGARLGILPMVNEPIKLQGQQGEIKYSCSVNLYLGEKKVGYGYALCSNLEPNKRGFAEYAIASMAQTRAVGKAYRNLLAWIIKAAGFEPTPAEEMDEVVSSPTPPIEKIKEHFKEAKVIEEPKKEKKSSKDMNDEELRQALQEILNKLPNGEQTLEEYTTFKSKDGDLIRGVRDINKLTGKRLFVTYQRIKTDMEGSI